MRTAHQMMYRTVSRWRRLAVSVGPLALIALWGCPRPPPSHESPPAVRTAATPSSTPSDAAPARSSASDETRPRAAPPAEKSRAPGVGPVREPARGAVPTQGPDAGAPHRGDSALPPYPQAFIDQTRAAHRMGCYGLVYKRGCAVLRRGRVRVTVRLGPDGAVTQVEPVSNTIRVDPGLVMRCVRKELASWRFPPPKGVSPTFEMEFVFSDRC